jgi:nicotinate-nucleotide pyrophosphorylase (carboxylating)
MPHLPPDTYREIVRGALAEDVGAGDVTTAATVPADQRGRGHFLAKAEGIVAGLDVAFEAFRQIEPTVQVERRFSDGARIVAGDVIGVVDGLARTLLTAERTALNLLQRLSGIATLTRRFVDASGGRITVLDTRKTTPLLRGLEKYAVGAGGGTNHRMGLYDAFLVKDNHVRLAGGVEAAIERARAYRSDLAIEVEAQSLAEVEQALNGGADIILLDNMTVVDMRAAVSRVAGRAKLEISGGVTLDRLPELATTGADYVSAGALTHSAPALDISFEIEPQ